MKTLLIILAIIGLLKLVNLFLKSIILLVKNNINVVVDNKCEKHYHEIKQSFSCGICNWLYIIPTIKTAISSKFFEIEIDIFFFYLFISYKIVDIDKDES